MDWVVGEGSVKLVTAARRPRSDPGVGEGANDGGGRLTFFMALWAGASSPRAAANV